MECVDLRQHQDQWSSRRGGHRRAHTAARLRARHRRADGCAKRILTAYGLLLRDKLCIVCDTHTSHTEWGAPMCMGGTCKDIYMHEESQTGALEKALVLVLNTELIALT